MYCHYLEVMSSNPSPGSNLGRVVLLSQVVLEPNISRGQQTQVTLTFETSLTYVCCLWYRADVSQLCITIEISGHLPIMALKCDIILETGKDNKPIQS